MTRMSRAAQGSAFRRVRTSGRVRPRQHPGPPGVLARPAQTAPLRPPASPGQPSYSCCRRSPAPRASTRTRRHGPPAAGESWSGRRPSAPRHGPGSAALARRPDPRHGPCPPPRPRAPARTAAPAVTCLPGQRASQVVPGPRPRQQPDAGRVTGDHPPEQLIQLRARYSRSRNSGVRAWRACSCRSVRRAVHCGPLAHGTPPRSGPWSAATLPAVSSGEPGRTCVKRSPQG